MTQQFGDKLRIFINRNQKNKERIVDRRKRIKGENYSEEAIKDIINTTDKRMFIDLGRCDLMYCMQNLIHLSRKKGFSVYTKPMGQRN